MASRSAPVLLSFPLLIAVASLVRAQTTTRVSVDATGIQGNAQSDFPTLSADGRIVAFASSAGNLVPDDSNGVSDVFVYDRLSGEIARVSQDSGGDQGNSWSAQAAISADGRCVAFVSDATNLVPNDANGFTDAFVHDRVTGVTSRVNLDWTGAAGQGGVFGISISADGLVVAFASAGRLVPDDVNYGRDIYVHDRATGRSSLVSVDSAGNSANRESQFPSISADARFVAFESYATNLVPGDATFAVDIFVHDRSTGETSLASVDSNGVQADDYSMQPSISADGRFVAFRSFAANLVPGDTNRQSDIFVRDRLSGETSRVSVTSTGLQVSAWNLWPSISADGRYVAFLSGAANLVPGDTNGTWDDFVHDRWTGRTTRVTVSSTGDEANGGGSVGSISPDGRSVAFGSDSNDLAPGDTNQTSDVFVRDWLDCRAGNVNRGAGEATDVLFVNDSAGGVERTVRLFSGDPLTIFMSPPPSAPGFAPFALFAWRVLPEPFAPPFTVPMGVGETCLPTPLTPGSPAPRIVWNNTGSALAGEPTLPSSPAPSIVLQRARVLGRPASVFVQGFIRDRAAPNGRAAVTNGVTIEIR